MTFKITTSGQGQQNLERIAGPHRSLTVARIINTPRGWLAYRGDSWPVTDAVPVQVSRFVNQHDGAQKIAEALGLS